MPRVETEVIIQAPLELVWQLAQDVEKLPQIMPDLDAVRILEKQQTTPTTLRTVTDWQGRIKQFNRKMEWTEEDIWNADEHTCHFWQLKGDFTEYRGEWRFNQQGDATRAYLLVDYTFDIPLIGAMMKKVIQKLMQDNADGMLKALRDEAERQAKSGS